MPGSDSPSCTPELFQQLCVPSGRERQTVPDTATRDEQLGTPPHLAPGRVLTEGDCTMYYPLVTVHFHAGSLFSVTLFCRMCWCLSSCFLHVDLAVACSHLC